MSPALLVSIPTYYVIAFAIVAIAVLVMRHDFKTGGWGSGILAMVAFLGGLVALLAWTIVCAVWMPEAFG